MGGRPGKGPDDTLVHCRETMVLQSKYSSFALKANSHEVWVRTVTGLESLNMPGSSAGIMWRTIYPWKHHILSRDDGSSMREIMDRNEAAYVLE